jgi:hypothetical protein
MGHNIVQKRWDGRHVSNRAPFGQKNGKKLENNNLLKKKKTEIIIGIREKERNDASFGVGLAFSTGLRGEGILGVSNGDGGAINDVGDDVVPSVRVSEDARGGEDVGTALGTGTGVGSRFEDGGVGRSCNASWRSLRSLVMLAILAGCEC